jgi:hypothetical protein
VQRLFAAFQESGNGLREVEGGLLVCARVITGLVKISGVRELQVDKLTLKSAEYSRLFG